MGTVAEIVRGLVAGLLWPFDQVSALIGLTLVSILTGVGMLWVVGKTTNQRALERARDRMVSAVYEVRLYLDAPRRAFAAQGRLLASSVRYMAHLIPGLLVVLVPLALVYPQLEIRHGLASLPVGRPLLAQVDLAKSHQLPKVVPAPQQQGLRITAPPLSIPREGRVYIRFEAVTPGEHQLQLQVGDQTVAKRISAGRGARVVSPERTAGILGIFNFSAERLLPADSGVSRITVAHPDRRFLGTSLPWWLYWLGLATVVALLLRRPMGVTI